MNTTWLKQIFSVRSLVTLAVIGSGLFAQAKATIPADEIITSPPQDTEVTVTQIQSNEIPGNLLNQEENLAPAPLTSASALRGEPVEAQTPETASETTAPVVAQANITPGRATRSGSSYIGIGGNIGFTGDTTLGEGAFAVISKIGFTNTLSVRPAALIGDNVVFLVPITVDFPIAEAGQVGVGIAPYLGGGVEISTGDDSNVGILLSGGVDVPVSPQFTATAGVNVGFLDKTDVGLLIGVGYNF